MGAHAVLQKRVTLTGTTANGDVSTFQPMRDWLDAGNWADAIFTLYVEELTVAGTDVAYLTIATAHEKELDATAGSVPDGPGWVVGSTGEIEEGKWYKILSTLERAGLTTGSDAISPMDRWVIRVPAAGSPRGRKVVASDVASLPDSSAPGRPNAEQQSRIAHFEPLASGGPSRFEPGSARMPTADAESGWRPLDAGEWWVVRRPDSARVRRQVAAASGQSGSTGVGL